MATVAPRPKHGLARGTAAYGSPGSDEAHQLFDLFAQCTALRTWAGDQGIVLDDTPESLPTLDRLLDPSAAETDGRSGTSSSFGARLGKEVGQYVGTVIVKRVPGAAWHVWPNSHSVVCLPSAKDLDVIAQVDRRLTSHWGTLMSMYAAIR